VPEVGAGGHAPSLSHDSRDFGFSSCERDWSGLPLRSRTHRRVTSTRRSVIGWSPLQPRSSLASVPAAKRRHHLEMRTSGKGLYGQGRCAVHCFRRRGSSIRPEARGLHRTQRPPRPRPGTRKFPHRALPPRRGKLCGRPSMGDVTARGGCDRACRHAPGVTVSP
jgi:hypothetical protein